MITPNIINDFLYQGDVAEVTIPVQDSSGKVIDLTGATMEYKIKSSSGAPITLVDKTVGSGITITNGQATLRIESVDTATLPPGPYFHQLRMTDAQSDPETLFQGTLRIMQTG